VRFGTGGSCLARRAVTTCGVTLPKTRTAPLVVLVDEDACVVRTLAATLKWAGFDVLSAATPAAALAAALCCESPIDLLVAAVLMGEMNGPELAREIARYHPRIRTLFITAVPECDVVRHEVIGRGYPCLAKPFVSRAFLAAIRELLGARGQGGSRGTPAAASGAA
jgi:two-component system, OmpR family, response regulator